MHDDEWWCMMQIVRPDQESWKLSHHAIKRIRMAAWNNFQFEAIISLQISMPLKPWYYYQTKRYINDMMNFAVVMKIGPQPKSGRLIYSILLGALRWSFRGPRGRWRTMRPAAGLLAVRALRRGLSASIAWGGKGRGRGDDMMDVWITQVHIQKGFKYLVLLYIYIITSKRMRQKFPGLCWVVRE